jgi:sulfur carrier protein ThiS
MKIHVEPIGFLADADLPNGSEWGEFDVPEGSTVQDVLVLVGMARRSLILTVNGRWVPPEHALSEGDRIRLVPPIGGG